MGMNVPSDVARAAEELSERAHATANVGAEIGDMISQMDRDYWTMGYGTGYARGVAHAIEYILGNDTTDQLRALAAGDLP